MKRSQDFACIINPANNRNCMEVIQSGNNQGSGAPWDTDACKEIPGYPFTLAPTAAPTPPPTMPTMAPTKAPTMAPTDAPSTTSGHSSGTTSGHSSCPIYSSSSSSRPPRSYAIPAAADIAGTTCAEELKADNEIFGCCLGSVVDMYSDMGSIVGNSADFLKGLWEAAGSPLMPKCDLLAFKGKAKLVFTGEGMTKEWLEENKDAITTDASKLLPYAFLTCLLTKSCLLTCLLTYVRTCFLLTLTHTTYLLTY